MRGVILAIVLLPFVAFAQSDEHAEAHYDAQGRMITLSSIYGSHNASQSLCQLGSLTGVITLVEYDGNGVMTNFYLKAPRDMALDIYLTGITADHRLPMSEVKKMPTLISKGKRVQVFFYACDHNGIIHEAEEITALD